MKNTLKDSDFIKPGYENLYGKVYLLGMKNMKWYMNGVLMFIIFFAFSVYVVPNPYKMQVSSILMFANNTRIVLTLALCFIMYIGIKQIYQSSQPWKYGLEFSIYFLVEIGLSSINCIFIAMYMTEYLYRSNYLFIYLDVLLIFVFIIGTLIFFRMRGHMERASTTQAIESIGPIWKYQLLGVVVFLIITFINFSQEETIMYIFSLLLSLLSSFAFPVLICDIYCLFYKEGIDFDIFYEFADGIDPHKHYPLNFGATKKKKKNSTK